VSLFFLISALHAVFVHPIMGSVRGEANVVLPALQRGYLNLHPDFRAVRRPESVAVFCPAPKVRAPFPATDRRELLTRYFSLRRRDDGGLRADDKIPVGRYPRAIGVLKIQAGNAENTRDTRPPSRISRCVGGFPLGAQIVAALILIGAAWLAFWRSTRPFGLISISRRDVREGIAYATVSISLFGLGGWIWMLGA
jgi:hypothetical protein